MTEIQLDQAGMLSYVREKPPFFLPETAVIVEGVSITTTTRLEEKHMPGHFPGFPVVPLIRMCEVGAQSGLVLATYAFFGGDASKRDKYVPLAVGCGASEATSEELVTAPCTLIVQGVLTKSERGRFEVDLTFLAETGDSGPQKVGYLRAVKYWIVPARGPLRNVG